MEELCFLLSRLYTISAVPFRIFRYEEREPIFAEGVTIQNDCLNQTLLCTFQNAVQSGRSLFIHDVDRVSWFGVTGNTDTTVVLGPVTFRQIDPYILQLFAKQYALPTTAFQLRMIAPRTLTGQLCLIHHYLTGEKRTESDITEPIHTELSDSEADDVILFDPRNGILHSENVSSSSFFNQINFLDKIRTGDIEAVKRIEVGGVYELPHQMVKNWEKNLEYLICASITLATQAAIEGGLPYESAYALNAHYLQKLEKCKKTDDFVRVNFDMKNSFARAVNDVKQTPTMQYSVKIMRFISAHLNESFTLSDIASFCKRDQTYLARKFKEETGRSIMQEARRQRTEKAAELLRKTDFSIQQIADLFCFASQSHFGSVFKSLYGCTPAEYRNQRH